MYIVNVEGAIFHGDKWLIIERSLKEEHAGGTLSFVGGKVEENEPSSEILERTVQREIGEEVGIEIKDQMKYVCSSSFISDDGWRVLNIVFLCEYRSGTPYSKSTDEVENVYWMSTEEILDHPNSPIWLKEYLVKANKLREEHYST